MIIALGSSPDQSRQINHLLTGRSFGEGQETACRRPRAIRHAFTLALMHKHFYEFVRETSKALDGLIRELR